jgi:hypothetical protein
MHQIHVRTVRRECAVKMTRIVLVKRPPESGITDQAITDQAITDQAITDQAISAVSGPLTQP